MSGQNLGAVYVLFRKGDDLLFVQRSNTGYLDGMHSLPAGRVEVGEPYTVAAAREAFEEVGLQVSPDDIAFLYMQHRLGEDGTVWTDVFFDSGDWHGQPVNAEPDKHSDIGWIDCTDLPDVIMPYQKYALERIAEGKLYGEFGWNTIEK